MDLLIKIIKRFWIINCFGIFVLSACTPASSQEKLLTPKEGNFSILMPGTILEEVTSPGKGINNRNWTTIKSESIYSVTHSTFTKQIAPQKIPKVLQLLIKAANKTNFIQGKQVSQSSVNKSGYNCQDFTLMGKPSTYLQKEFKKKGLNINNQLFYQRSLLCMKNNYAVEAVIITPSSEELKTNGASFIKSLNLKA
ncbi:MAG: hypothetical protein RM347_003680 [Nostoc sp. ChiQUE02]|uniref:hypothetical protein n=1 Tax=Nostoc sp. ChiQUE02 TaxID=3075377 RepID=UPI002AD1E7D2|nr:hypothetical protein [Nostoc sp. ChiQUE02]MDZ8231113.1 hypothetical protein [Nostoc sp. ChiQUE02]